MNTTIRPGKPLISPAEVASARCLGRQLWLNGEVVHPAKIARIPLREQTRLCEAEQLRYANEECMPC